MPSDLPIRALETRPIPELIEDPLLSDHRWFLEEIGRLIALAGRVEGRFAAHHRVPSGLGMKLRSLREGLTHHIDSEEQLIFPAVLSGTASEVRGAIRDLEDEHRTAARILEQMREIAGGMIAPDDADDDWKSLCASLADVARRIELHARIEDEILFPRVFFEQPETGGQDNP